MPAVDKVTFKWDLSDYLDGVNVYDRSNVLNSVGQYLVEAILADVGEAKSPVTGRAFKGLSPAYKKIKEQFSSSVIANLELTGAMLDALEYRISGTVVEVGIWGDQADKADGHNNFSGKSKLPERPFIPYRDEKFRPEIRDQVMSILEDKIGPIDGSFT